ncbi:Sec-independent protein translocase protein TatB [Alkalilimnicola sp. S0819]|uniref:Sec-independent protein translocase protein TatB n=1 Tax=Alkalilimnicola sp. S0819 TaxID=2613922 RepID=UPI001261B3B2|nr:Sec-independent protein translocase protein TatB [Alkalilimnicola sp. S0819]KAB7627260.1 twin-arginine translocase subunit TatB [Alkalilimnicola sp. S0819]MPQ15973.1 twin-arginine translocase subunit TatB [Alkalilimnicola sp. S0819]
MFDIGFWELCILAVLGLVILGPERLPRVLRMIGLWVGRARASYQALRTEMERELRVDDMNRARQRMEDEARAMGRSVEDVSRQFEEATRTDTPPPPDDPPSKESPREQD